MSIETILKGFFGGGERGVCKGAKVTDDLARNLEENHKIEVEDPTEKLGKLAIDVNEGMSKLPFEEVEKIVNDENLKKCLLFINGIIYLTNHDWYELGNNAFGEFFNEKNRSSFIKNRKEIEKFIAENPLLNERISRFIYNLSNYFELMDNAFSCKTEEEFEKKFKSSVRESRLLLKSKSFLAYNDLLQPLTELVFAQKDQPEAVKKYFAEYVAKCGLFPYDSDDYQKVQKVFSKISCGTIMKNFGRLRIPLGEESYDSYTKQWGDGVDWKDLTRFLKLFGVGFYPVIEDGDVKIKLNPYVTIPGSHFEDIEIHVRDEFEKMKDLWAGKGKLGISDEKLHELEHADLVLIYRDNDTYSDMRKTLENLVKTKYGGKVYCISIDRTIQLLDEDEINVLRHILSTCPCITDSTVSTWTGMKTKKIDKLLSEELRENQKNFIDIAENIESYCMEKGIDTVYLISDGELRADWRISLLEHGGLCQKEDGTIYYVYCSGGSEFGTIEKHEEDSKRFRKNMFPNINVEFVSGKMYRTNFGQRGWFPYSKSKGALAIVDHHFEVCLEKFKADGGETILFAGCNFQDGGGIEKFSDSNDGKRKSHGERMAESIFSGK